MVVVVLDVATVVVVVLDGVTSSGRSSAGCAQAAAIIAAATTRGRIIRATLPVVSDDSICFSTGTLAERDCCDSSRLARHSVIITIAIEI